MPESVLMEKRNKKPVATDRHKPSRMIRLPALLYAQLEKLAERNVTNPTQETIRAVREYLESQQLWPPKD